MTDLKVLIIEDDLVYATKLSHWLEATTKNIFIATSAEEGTQLASKVTPDIILLDNYLPGVKGKDSIEIFKKVICPDAFVILMSANYKIDDIATGIQNGADHLFDKHEFDNGTLNELLIGIDKAINHKESLWRFLDIFKSSNNTEYLNNIAILDDDDLFTFHLNWFLSENTYHNIINSFARADSFFKHYEGNPPDLIFLDYFLPDTEGNEVLKEIKKKFPKAKIIIISSQNDPKTALELNKMGIESYVVKYKGWKEEIKKIITDMKVM